MTSNRAVPQVRPQETLKFDDAKRLETKKKFLTYIQSANLSLAALLRSRREYDSALLIYEQCLEERKTLLGNDHPDTLLIINATAYTLYLNGEHERALPLLEESLDKWQAMYGRDHPNTKLYRSRRDDCRNAIHPNAASSYIQDLGSR
jgi:tetratricopeptide (TPR) repeat protein